MKREMTDKATGIPYALQEPYPEIESSRMCIQNIAPLTRDLACQNGELTAVYQYIYQSIVLRGTHPELAQTIFQIALVEMHHLDMFGQLITKLGGMPRAVSMHGGRAYSWNGWMPDYAQNPHRILTVNIQQEKETVKRYTEQAESLEDEAVCRILLRIASDEQLHIRIFEAHLNLLKTNKREG